MFWVDQCFLNIPVDAALRDFYVRGWTQEGPGDHLSSGHRRNPDGSRGEDKTLTGVSFPETRDITGGRLRGTETEPGRGVVLEGRTGLTPVTGTGYSARFGPAHPWE